jgi:hypothetical protein
MHVRFLAIGGDGMALAGKEHEIRILDDKDEVEHVADVKTSRFGIASTDWGIPANAKSGEYQIEVMQEGRDEPFRHPIAIRRYELPSFRVAVKPDRPYYLLKDKATVEVRADYLFGRPVTAGSVRITEDDDQKPQLEGKLTADGSFRGVIDSNVDIGDSVKFVDRHFTAFVTDVSTNRTEQRKFDLRVSRDPLHVYLVKDEYTATVRRLYASTFTPDGGPARSDVEVISGKDVVGTGHTDRYGLTRIDIPKSDESKLVLRATTADGRQAQEQVESYENDPGLWLETDHTLYRAGQPVRCHIGAEEKSSTVLLLAWNSRNETVFSQNVRLNGGLAEVMIPYSVHFGRVLSVGVVAGVTRSTTTREVVFPGPDDLVLRAATPNSTYRPGEMATVQFRASSEAALGVAIVDQSVLERAATDQAFQRSYWSNDGQSFGGIGEHDLLNLAPAKIDDDLQLVAEVLLPQPMLVNNAYDFSQAQRDAFEKSARKTLDPIREALDDHYLQTLESPRDEASLFGVLGQHATDILDPWMQPYRPRFSTEGTDDVIRFVSAGPDKQLGTEDDFSALEIRRKWFAKFEALIREKLVSLADFPADEDAFVRVLDEAGVRFRALRDPWGSPFKVNVEIERDQRRIRILSAGPDHVFGTTDDVRVAEFNGHYFTAIADSVRRVLNAAKQFPRTTDELQTVLIADGLDFSALRDPWGWNYYAEFQTKETYADDVQAYSYSEYDKRLVEQRKEITPIKRTVLTVEIRSVGEDGIRGTYDDFPVATFDRVIEGEKPKPEPAEKAKTPAFSIGGTGSITGVVTDQTGAVIPDAQVTLDDVYVTHTNADGKYSFRGMKPGTYKLKFESPGFQVAVIDRIPVKADGVTRADYTLNVGTVSEMVSVAAAAPIMNADTAEVSAVAASSATSTPRVREYFPETLYWQPELVTHAAGNASVTVKLADTITSWHVAVIGSTVDGRISETSTDIRAFQPFMVDLDVPSVLTAGDEIELPVPVRNYLDHAQKVAVSASVPPQLSLIEAVRQPGQIEASSSANAVLDLRADASVPAARLRVTAVAKEASDAIEKPVSIHPDGQRREASVNDAVTGNHALLVNVPATAIKGSLQAEVKFYPSLLARILESMESMLTRPYGCGEQTVSSTYPNLLFLRALRDAHVKQERLEAKAMKNLTAGYQRLLGYQDDSGGFTYWGHGDPDVSLTAYALTFLRDAKDFINVDDDRVEKAEEWLKKQDTKQQDSAHTLQVEALIRTGLEKADAIDRMLGELARDAAKYDDPYAVAAFALAALDAGKPDIAQAAIDHLRAMAQDEQGAVWWDLRANTPFHGWGRWGQVETTAMALTALAKWRKARGADAATDTLMQRGALFLLRNTDASGGWATSQATVRALTALLDLWAGTNGEKASSIEVMVNGTRAGSVAIPAGNEVQGPVTLNISPFVRASITNEISFAGAGASATEVQTNAVWYEKWSKPESSKDLRFDVRFSGTAATINQQIACDVFVSRPTFRGYGMLIAEIGLPPGAEVDRGTLASIVDDAKSGVDSFEVAPDRVTFYIWPRAADSRFHFVFRPRFAMKARAMSSVLYDYYNPDERVVIAPELFTVE